MIHIAYQKAINDHNNKNLIFYHIHNPDTYAQLNFSNFNPRTKWVMMVREPIQSCGPLGLIEPFLKKDYSGLVASILIMLFEIDNIFYTRHQSVGIRLEDLKTKPKKTIPALCKWMGILENESLYEMTAQGKKWWGDPSSRDYSNDGPFPLAKHP